MAEFVEGYERLVHIKPSVSIFGSARTEPDHPYYKLAETLGEQLSNAGFSIVTGGGPGIMEGANKGAFKGNSFSIGLNIVLPHEEGTNQFQDISLRFRHFFTRKVMFFKYATAFVVCPGGFGTLDELAEILALTQTRKTRTVPVVLVNKAFWTPLIDWFKNTLVTEKMIDAKDVDLFEIVDTPEEVVSYMKEYFENHSIDPTPRELEVMRNL